MLEAAKNEERLRYQERLELVKDFQPESKSAMYATVAGSEVQDRRHRTGWILGNVWSWNLSGI